MKRLNVYLPEAVEQKLKDGADRLGLTYSKMATLAITAGVDAVTLALNPEWATALQKLSEFYEKKAENNTSS